MRLIICLLVLSSCSPQISSSEKAAQEPGRSGLPVVIRYSRMISLPPDSISDFISVYLQSKGVWVIDTAEANNLQDMEIKRVWQANVKKGDPPPDFAALGKKMNTVVYSLGLSIYSDLLSQEFAVDSIRWSVYEIPFNFEKKPRFGSLYPEKSEDRSLYLTLKGMCDTLLSKMIR